MRYDSFQLKERHWAAEQTVESWKITRDTTLLPRNESAGLFVHTLVFCLHFSGPERSSAKHESCLYLLRSQKSGYGHGFVFVFVGIEWFINCLKMANCSFKSEQISALTWAHHTTAQSDSLVQLVICNCWSSVVPLCVPLDSRLRFCSLAKGLNTLRETQEGQDTRHRTAFVCERNVRSRVSHASPRRFFLRNKM